MKRRMIFVMVLMQAFFIARGQGKEFVITAYGAKPDGINNTASIQKAIDDAANAGGGTVVIPRGTFITGTLVLKSGVKLDLDAGAVLKGSSLYKDYEAIKPRCIIYAKGQKDIAISGSGIIDGQGRELMKDIFLRLQEGTLTDPNWKTKRPAEATRTNLIYFEECHNINISGTTFKDATSWVTHYERCNGITIKDIKIESRAYWNNDGIDIVDCRNVRISNADINTADDGICLKSSGRNEYCDSVWVDNCTIRSSASAFKLGTSSTGGFKNITVRRLKVFDTYRSAIALEAVDGGFLENVDIQQVTAVNTGNAIFIKLGHRNNEDIYSTVKNIYISDVHVEVSAGKPDAGYEMEGPLLRYPPGIHPLPGKIISVSPWNNSYNDPEAVLYRHNVFPSSISGLPDHAVENVTLENITITYAGGADTTVNYMPLDSAGIITEAEKDYPEFSMFGELPAWGFYIRHVKGLVLRNVKLNIKKTDYRTGILIGESRNVTLKNITLSGPISMPAVFVNKSNDISVKRIKAPANKKRIIKTR